jgi:hypothetical protein
MGLKENGEKCSQKKNESKETKKERQIDKIKGGHEWMTGQISFHLSELEKRVWRMQFRFRKERGPQINR